MPRLLPLFPLLLVAVACSAPSAALTATDLEDLVIGLCDAVHETDLTSSEAAFFNRAHAPLHTLADALRDEALANDAADLLIVKQRVEASYTQDLPATLLRDNLTALLSATDDGLAALRLAPINCDQGTSS